MWYNLAATQLQDGKHKERAVKNRENVTKHMNPKQVVEAQQMAGNWQTKGK